MKKPLLILALALSIFEFAPLGFCAPKTKPVEPISKAKKVKKPKNAKKSSKSRYKKIVINTEIFLNTSLPQNKKGNYLLAPQTRIISSGALVHNSNIEVIELPKIRYILKYAFSECKNLKKIILGDDLQEVFPSAFLKCNPNLKLVYKGKEYSTLEFFKEMDQPMVFKNPEKELRTKIEKHSSNANVQAKNPQIKPNVLGIKFVPVPVPVTMTNFPVFPLVNLPANKPGFCPTVKCNVAPNQQLFFNPASIKNFSFKEPSVIESSIDDE